MGVHRRGRSREEQDVASRDERADGLEDYHDRVAARHDQGLLLGVRQPDRRVQHTYVSVRHTQGVNKFVAGYLDNFDMSVLVDLQALSRLVQSIQERQA